MNRRDCVLKSPKEIRVHRKDFPVRRKEGDQEMYKTEGPGNQIFTRAKAVLPSDKNRNFTYGMPVRFIFGDLILRPSTPVALLMTDKYQKEFNAKREKAAAEREKAMKVKYYL